MAGVEVLRRIAEEGEPPVTVRLVDWADEEGARFRRSGKARPKGHSTGSPLSTAIVSRRGRVELPAVRYALEGVLAARLEAEA
jgi:hypothetical protein